MKALSRRLLVLIPALEAAPDERGPEEGKERLLQVVVRVSGQDPLMFLPP